MWRIPFVVEPLVRITRDGGHVEEEIEAGTSWLQDCRFDGEHGCWVLVDGQNSRVILRRGRAGDKTKIKNFTGVDDPYEDPDHAELVIETDKETVEESISRILAKLIELGYLEAEEDVKVIAESPTNLGYL